MRNSRKQQRTGGSSRRKTTSPRRSPAGPSTSRRRPAAAGTAHRGTRSRLARTLVDHDEIRRWAEERGGKPSAVKGTSRSRSDVGMIRLDFPGYSGERKLAPIGWDAWFDKFDASNLALVVQDKTARGEISHFNKLVAREGSPRRARPRTRMRAQARAQR